MRAIIAALAASMLLLPAPNAHAARVVTTFDICAALRHGTSLGVIESTLTAGGYSSSDAGALTGSTVRDHCPDQISNVTAQVKAAQRQRATS
jgi:hypothetical protein